MTFRPILEDVLRNVDGAVSVSLMGIDGIPIEEVRCSGDAGDAVSVDLISAEYAALQKRIAKTNEGLDMQSFQELQVITDGLSVVMSMVSSDYFLLLLSTARHGLGRARYELHKAQLRVQGEIS